MHFVRRAAARAASSASTSFISQSRAINTSSPSFLLRSAIKQNRIAPSLFRKYSNDVSAADGEQSSIDNATESAGGLEEGAGGAAGRYAQSRGGYEKREPRSAYDRGDRGDYRGAREDRRPSDRPRREMKPLEPTDTVYIGNLLFEVTAADLEREFAEFGTIVSSTVATDSRQLSKGFGYVQFESIEQAKAAIEAKNETTFEGRRLVVNYMNKSGPKTTSNPPSKTLFIGNLAFEMSDKDLNTLFRDIRNVVDVRVAIDRRTGQPRGFAHADFVDVESAEKAFEALQGKEAYGRSLRLDYSQGRPEGGSAYGGGDRQERSPRARY